MAKEHTVRQGDTLSSIAKQYGFTSWQTIYDHADNAKFRDLRPNPNLIYPGDTIFIPTKNAKHEDRGTEDKHQFRLKAQKTLLKIVVEDLEKKPLKGKDYQLRIGKELILEGVTDGTGLVKHEIPADAKEGELTVFALGGGYTWKLNIGHLDPIEEVEGVQARLNNLGYDCGAVDGAFGLKTKRALQAFQSDLGLEPTGDIDEATRGRLKQEHDRD